MKKIISKKSKPLMLFIIPIIAISIMFSVFLIPQSASALLLPEGVSQRITIDGKTLKVNETVATEKGYLVYGTAADVPGNDYKNSSGAKVSASTPGSIPRYLGYDVKGNKYSNFDFPVDADSGRDPWDKSWIKYPWDEGYCNYPPYYNTDNNASAWLDRLNWPGWTGEKLKDYLLIQSPPTDYSPGTCVGWHIYLGKPWYQVFSIEPDKKLDLKGNITENGIATGCFLDFPRKVGNQMETYVIRSSEIKITEPVYVPVKIWLLENLDENISFIDDKIPKNIGWGKLVFDDYIKLTADKNYWVKKITYPVPLVGHKSGILVQTGSDAIENGRAVTNYCQNVKDFGLTCGSHTTSEYERLDFIPWNQIEAEYGIKRLRSDPS
jgi:hypothetical protein